MTHAFSGMIHTMLAQTATLFVGGLLVVTVTGCSLLPLAGISEEGMAYFKNPKQAVDSIRIMLKSKAWEELSRYYDLSGTDIDRASLVSGDFFIRKKRPEVAHQAGFWKFRQPFSPQFSYLSHQSISDEIVEVTVQVEIDEGGGMVQRGMDSFQLRKSSDGYQLLPKQFHSSENSSALTTPVKRLVFEGGGKC